ncbi:MAG: phytanoyl-CoA dioxygenase family protein [Gammaproteobacteria bacterium]
MSSAIAQREPIPTDCLGSLQDSSQYLDDERELRRRLADDGYVYLREFFPRDDIMAAREAIFSRLAEVGEVEEPLLEGIYSGTSQRLEKVQALGQDLGQFWRSVSETWALRRLSHGRQLHELMDKLLDGKSRAQDYIFLRPANPGKHTAIHCDYPFFTRHTDTVATAWVALGDVPLTLGPLFIIEGSHRFQDIIDAQQGFDIARDSTRKAAFPQTPLEFARQRNTRLLSTDFKAGDIVIFGMFLLHGALDNIDPDRRIRLSCDVRYQLAEAATDPRYFGPDPGGTTGAGYGELVGAKPLTDAWHVR